MGMGRATHEMTPVFATFIELSSTDSLDFRMRCGQRGKVCIL